ncbi:LysR family transcriptional regulator [Acidaminobacter sp. JC074]|uniref:LysR family transcriptional regulator n=1 Tax=Acidaminobacter sp. JC074 TaxID=2530199 RepID=UPI001F0F2681|nr:LysR family transcriptional regulator [Acidaminobacter sp. JC074]MCH4889401.1 LysR family transcriptional regulator [Acidaminobacter sp. JC074]
MDSDKCKVLLEVIHLKSITKAAEKLGYTTSGVSRLIQSLEEEAGFPLIIRNRKGIEITGECRELLPLIKEMSRNGQKYEEALARIHGIEIGEIRIGTSIRNYYLWFAGIIADFQKSYPNIKISIVTDNSTKLLKSMLSNEIDLCLISKRPGSYEWIQIAEKPIVAWLPASHSLASQASFPLSMFETDDYISTYPDQETDNSRLLEAHGIKPNVKFTSTDSYATYCMVDAGLGISLDHGIIAESWKGNVVIKPLDPPLSISLGLAHMAKRDLSPAVSLFIKFARPYIDDIS